MKTQRKEQKLDEITIKVGTSWSQTLLRWNGNWSRRVRYRVLDLDGGLILPFEARAYFSAANMIIRILLGILVLSLVFVVANGAFCYLKLVFYCSASTWVIDTTSSACSMHQC